MSPSWVSLRSDLRELWSVVPRGIGDQKNCGSVLRERGSRDASVCVHLCVPCRKSHQECSGKAGGHGRPRQARRHKTCPTPREISKVMASLNLGVLSESSCSVDELLEECIRCFGEWLGQPLQPNSQPASNLSQPR